MVRPTLSRLSLLARTPPHPLLVLHPEVQAALASRASASTSSRPATPLVALESTIITHGMPYPTNLSTARRVEEQVRSQGAVPATIALLDGKIHVGCDEAQLERLAESAQVKGRAFKTGRRDLAGVLARKIIGGTTVSGTALVAHLAGINIFATGGIGGVHRGAELSFDISSDLTELSRTPLNIFCSGAKSILDIPLTLEYLETQGVSTYSFNPSGEFPAFYTAKSGTYATPVQDERSAAEIILQGERYGLQSGSVFGVPIPSDCEGDGAEIQKAVELAVAEAKQLGVDKKGKEVTPWLLARVGELTKGTSLKSNVELVVNNAGVAARTAKAYEALRWEAEQSGQGQGKLFTGFGDGGGSTSPSTSEASPAHAPELLLFGCAALDIVSRSTTLNPTSTSRGSVRFSLGGVGRNMAEAAHKVLASASASTSATAEGSKSSKVRMVAPLADDPAGTLVRVGLQKLGMDITALFVPSAAAQASSSRSPVCSLHLDGVNDLVTGVADMALVEEALTPGVVRAELKRASSHGGARVIAFDANLTADAMGEVIRHKVEHDDEVSPRPILFFEPTSTAKCTRIIDALAALHLSNSNSDSKSGSGSGSTSTPLIDFTTPNLIELEAMVARAAQIGLISAEVVPSPPSLSAAPALSAGGDPQGMQEYIHSLCQSLAPFFAVFLVTMGERGVLSASPSPSMSRSRSSAPSPSSPLHFTHHPPATPAASSRTDGKLSLSVVSTTGAGDTFAGAVLAGLCLHLRLRTSRTSRTSSSASHPESETNSPGAALSPEALEELVQLGQRAALLTLQSQEAVAEDLGGALLGLPGEGEREGLEI